jgi:hypothetical protein
MQTETAVPWLAEYPHPNVAIVRIEVNARSEFEQRFLLTSDRHWDNPHSDHDMQRRHLDEAKRIGAGVIDCGDFFCAMQGKYDKRSDKSTIRPEHQCSDYLDSLVRTAADFFEPYAENMIVVGRGNHETSIQGRHETDLTQRLCASLYDRTGHKVQAGGYTGWVRFQFTRSDCMMSRQLWYAHGWGGGGPVTINTIQAANRMPMMVEGADVIFTGHVHEAWVAEKVRTTLTHKGEPTHKTLYIVQGATYKDEYGSGYGGWHVHTGKPPKPKGAWWMTVRWNRSGNIEGPVLSFERAN